MEKWLKIAGFPEYSVSDYGRVRNDEFNRIMALSINQNGIVHVGLTTNRVQRKMSVTRLVAYAFLRCPQHPSFDTPINLDGDRRNNFAANILWRPRWFATEYFRQFRETLDEKYTVPIRDADTGRPYDSSWEVAMEFGLLVRDVFRSAVLGSKVWPTNQIFALI